MSSRDKNLPYEILTLSHFGFKYCSVRIGTYKPNQTQETSNNSDAKKFFSLDHRQPISVLKSSAYEAKKTKPSVPVLKVDNNCGLSFSISNFLIIIICQRRN